MKEGRYVVLTGFMTKQSSHVQIKGFYSGMRTHHFHKNLRIRYKKSTDLIGRMVNPVTRSTFVTLNFRLYQLDDRKRKHRILPDTLL